MAASTNTVTKTPINTDLWKHTVLFQAQTGDATITPQSISSVTGRELVCAIVTNGATGVTAAATLKVADTVSGQDLVAAASNGANIGGNGVVVFAEPESSPANPYFYGPCTITIGSNAVEAATVTVTLITKPIV